MKAGYAIVTIASMLMLATAIGCKKEPVKATTPTTHDTDSTGTPVIDTTPHAPIAGTYVGNWIHTLYTMDGTSIDTTTDTILVTRYIADSIRFTPLHHTNETRYFGYDTTSTLYQYAIYHQAGTWTSHHAFDSLYYDESFSGGGTYGNIVFRGKRM